MVNPAAGLPSAFWRHTNRQPTKVSSDLRAPPRLLHTSPPPPDLCFNTLSSAAPRFADRTTYRARRCPAAGVLHPTPCSARRGAKKANVSRLPRWQICAKSKSKPTST
eukprot:COSAG06_NODE_3458_length_5314_cov_5.266155_4_plen_108_part_00